MTFSSAVWEQFTDGFDVRISDLQRRAELSFPLRALFGQDVAAEGLTTFVAAFRRAPEPFRGPTITF
jgi:hypothetical protein